MRTENILTEEARQQLTSLGYAGTGSGGPVRRDLPDPRQMADVALALHQATEKVQQQQCREALAELQAIVKRDPSNFPALSLAGYCLREAGRIEDALALFRRASEANDLSAVPIADAALKAGAHDPQVFYERGLIRATAGNTRGALADFREAARRDPSNPAPVENAARAAYQSGAKKEAASFYESLLRLAPNRLDVWKTLGALYLYELEDEPRALQAFRRALLLEQNPGEREKLESLVRELGG